MPADSPRRGAKSFAHPSNAVRRGAMPCNTTRAYEAFDETNPIFTLSPFPDDRARAALDRAAGAAVARIAPACDAVQHAATPRDAMQHESRTCKTKPTRAEAAVVTSQVRMAGGPSVGAEPIGRDDHAARVKRGACDAVQHGATSRDVVQPNPPSCITNPKAELADLDHRRLAACRLLAAGRSIAAVATKLGLCRSTVWRWQREPAFRAELRRIHDRMTTPAAATPPARTGLASLSPRDLALLRNALR